jgi:hypothetical protein
MICGYRVEAAAQASGNSNYTRSRNRDLYPGVCHLNLQHQGELQPQRTKEYMSWSLLTRADISYGICRVKVEAHGPP